MEKKPIVHRKQRTREHVIADLSVHHVEGFVLAEGHTAQRLDQDYGYDLVILTYDTHGYIEPGALFVQLKAAEKLKTVGSDYVFDLDIRDYNLWTINRVPVILILYDASQSQAYWLPIQRYFQANSTRGPRRAQNGTGSGAEEPTSRSIRRRANAGTQEPVGIVRPRRRAMRRTDVTYGQLDRVLKALGFSCRLLTDEPPAKLYEHKASGAYVTIPPFPDRDYVLDHHLAYAKLTIENFGIASAKVFASELQKTG